MLQRLLQRVQRAHLVASVLVQFGVAQAWCEGKWNRTYPYFHEWGKAMGPSTNLFRPATFWGTEDKTRLMIYCGNVTTTYEGSTVDNLQQTTAGALGAGREGSSFDIDIYWLSATCFGTKYAGNKFENKLVDLTEFHLSTVQKRIRNRFPRLEYDFRQRVRGYYNSLCDLKPLPSREAGKQSAHK